ncbi:hypothetical protein J5N97_021726 [Dioscorea zingiberensis]|uniref:Uncharacterized protein n=1 Tax=Dioscorea zingiberensis TaxID=325984 RepID=A0A9D5C9I1_9LILI|nr:hypothetical protein J5N97_021726 [Dioscorea zingiberensis]
MASSSLFLLFFFFFFSQFAVSVNGAAKVVPSGTISKVEDAGYFQMYYGQSFKVIKNSIDGKSYLLMQNTSRMALKTKYCTGRIKSFVIPLSNYSVDTTTVPGIDFVIRVLQLLGLLDYLKGMNSDIVTSECVLMSYANGGIQLVNKTDTQQFTQFTAHFIGNVDEERECNFAAFMPFEERTPLQRAEWIKYLATFTNSESRANSVYDAIKGNYMCLSKVAANLTTRFKPVVAWIDYNQGIWSFAKDTYKLQYVVDAGGENLDGSISNNSYNVSNPDDMDNFRAILCTVDVVIDQTYAEDPAEYTLSTFFENMGVNDSYCLGFVTNQTLWRYDKRAGNFSSLGDTTSTFSFRTNEQQYIILVS